jgi:hypothetical protein
MRVGDSSTLGGWAADRSQHLRRESEQRDAGGHGDEADCDGHPGQLFHVTLYTLTAADQINARSSVTMAALTVADVYDIAADIGKNSIIIKHFSMKCCILSIS